MGYPSPLREAERASSSTDILHVCLRTSPSLHRHPPCLSEGLFTRNRNSLWLAEADWVRLVVVNPTGIQIRKWSAAGTQQAQTPGLVSTLLGLQSLPSAPLCSLPLEGLDATPPSCCFLSVLSALALSVGLSSSSWHLPASPLLLCPLHLGNDHSLEINSLPQAKSLEGEIVPRPKRIDVVSSGSLRYL